MWHVRRCGLLAFAAAVPVLEALILEATGFRSAQSLAAQASALPPYGTFHDLRWVFVYHDSWPSFGAELVAAVMLRGLLGAALTALAWPAAAPRPPLRQLAGRNLAFAAVAVLVLWPWATIAVVAAEVSLSWILFLELLPVLVLAPFLVRGGMVAGWWRGLPTLRGVGLALASFALLSAGGAVIWQVPGWWTLPATALFGAADGLLWELAVRDAVLARRVRWRRVPVVPVVAVLTALALAGADDLATLVMRTVGRPAPPLVSLVEANGSHRPVIFLAGYDTAFPGGPSVVNGGVVRFSYRGSDGYGRPWAYRMIDTHQSLDTSAGLLAVQVDRVHRRTGEPVALLGESEGSLVARYYLARWPHPYVDAVALTSPIVRAGRVYYPPPGARSGWGVATGWQLRVLLVTLGSTNRVPDDADEPFLRSLMDNAPLFRNQMLCPVPGVRMIAFLPTADATAVPPGALAEIPVIEVTGFHGLLVDRPAVKRYLVDFLVGRQVIPPTRWDYSIVHRVAGAWQAPALALRLNPVWRAARGPDAAFERQACPR